MDNAMEAIVMLSRPLARAILVSEITAEEFTLRRRATLMKWTVPSLDSFRIGQKALSEWEREGGSKNERHNTGD